MLQKYIEWELFKFKKQLAISGFSSPDIQIVIKFNQCLARIWDNKNYDINKRCHQPELSYGLCKIHLKSTTSGRVNEYPCERKTLKYYRYHDPDIDAKININHSLENYIIIDIDNQRINNNLKISDKLYKEYNMNLDDILINLDSFCSNLDYSLDRDGLKRSVIKQISTQYNLKLTIGEYEKLYNQVDHIISQNISKKQTVIPKPIIKPKIKKIIIKKPAKQPKKIVENSPVESYDNISVDSSIVPRSNKDKSNLEDVYDTILINDYTYFDDISFNSFKSEFNDNEFLNHNDYITIIDDAYNQSDLFIKNIKGNQILFNEKCNPVGFMRDWVDENDEIPKDFKTKDNKVLNPDNNLPILEVFISTKGALYSGLESGFYREYSYDEELECFSKTSYIQKP